MTPERWRQISAIFHSALARDPEPRDAYLREAGAADVALRSEVESLMAAHHAAGRFGDTPVSVRGPFLEPGTSLGPYRIDRLLGAGGMGQVYRAHDPKLGRAVAIKVLSPESPSDAEQLARFEREARVLASLNHPHIGAIYGVEESEDVRALVMELVEGEDLAQQLARGPIPIAEALAIAGQIAAALEAAHEQGIIHRDLKPANIKVREDGTAKVLDFGLAKLAAPGGAGHDGQEPHDGRSEGDLMADVPILTLAGGTSEGLILGTAAYMSPEQARGKAVDRRTDLWSFGCVLYEMLAGRAAFAGDTVSDTIIAILEREPDRALLPAETPGPIRTLLRRCLEKDRKRRLDSAATARLEIDDVLAARVDEVSVASAPASRRRVSMAIAALAGTTLIAVLGTWMLVQPPPRAPQLPSRFAIVSPPTLPLNVSSSDRDLALSADGRHLVYRFAGTNTTGSPLMVRPIDQLDAHPVRGVVYAYAPFFSPDSRWIGFFEKAELKKVSIGGGPAITLNTVTGGSLGASWGDDNTIVFATDDPNTGLWRVSAEGGRPTVLTKPDGARHEGDHGFPSMVPGGRGVLYTIAAGGQASDAQVAVLDLKNGRRKTLLRGSQAEYVDLSPDSGRPGHLIYVEAGMLRAVQFDAVQLAVLGEPVTLDEHVMIKPTGAANFAISRLGTLVYMPRGTGTLTAKARSLVWVDRRGLEDPIRAPLRPYGIPRLSPDGTRVALEIADSNVDIWIWNFARETLSRLTFDPNIDSMSVWTPDARRIVFMSRRSGVLNVYRQAADGTGSVDRLTTSSTPQWPTSIAPDGTRLVGFDLEGNFVLFPLAHPARQFEHGPTSNVSPRVEGLIEARFKGSFAEVSPSGRYVAYESDESGRNEIYVRSFPQVNSGRWQISTGGATRPVWARSGRELFYLDEANTFIVVPVSTAGPTFTMGTPVKMFDNKYAEPNPARHYDVSPDGKRFLMLKYAAANDQHMTPASMIVVEHWFEEVRRLASKTR